MFARLRRAVSDLTLDKVILQEAARGDFSSLTVAGPVGVLWASDWVRRSVAPAAFFRQHRSVQRCAAKPRPDEEALTAAIVVLASRYGR